MEIIGTVVKVLPEQTGAGKKGEWKKQDIILEYGDKFPTKVCVSLWGDKVGTVQKNTKVTVSINLESREYNNRWYTEVKAWKIVSGSATNNETPKEKKSSDNEDDSLPF